MKRLLPLGLLLALVLLLQPAVGLAAWISHGTSTGSATATSVVKAGTPTVTRSGATAVVSWPQGVLANGLVSTGYTVKRTSGATTTTLCTVAEPTRTCTDSSPVPGSSTYVVVSRFNGWTGVASDPTTFVFDTDAPVTTLASNPAANGNGYVTSAPTLTLTATDASTSVASITYKIGAAAPVTVNAATASFTVSALGITTVTYAATDIAGNVESTKTYAVKRDGTAPVTSLFASPVPNAFGYFSSNPTIMLTAADAETSVTSVTYRIGAAAPVTVPGSSRELHRHRRDHHQRHLLRDRRRRQRRGDQDLQRQAGRDGSGHGDDHRPADRLDLQAQQRQRRLGTDLLVARRRLRDRRRQRVADRHDDVPTGLRHHLLQRNGVRRDRGRRRQL